MGDPIGELVAFTAMDRVAIALGLIAVVGIVAAVVGRRRRADPPTQRTATVPQQLDRVDFPRPDAPWLVVVFSSATCDVCRSVVDKAGVMASDDVEVVEVEFDADRALHQRYSINAVPTTVIADRAGVVGASFLGPVSATDLWASVATLRDPSAAPTDGCERHAG